MTANLYDSNWPELTFELQKYFILMIENSQRPLQYTGFGLSILNLETFSAVRESFSYKLDDVALKKSYRVIPPLREFDPKTFYMEYFYCSLLQMLKTVYTFYMVFKTAASD